MESIEAQSKQTLWQVYVLVPCTALLLYMSKVSFDPDFTEHSRSGLLNSFDPMTRAIFFGVCAAICAACVALAFWRRFSPRTELIVDDSGVTSKLFWGPGTLAWPAIKELTFQNNWMFVHGTDSAQKKKKLIVNLTGLDCPSSVILAAIYLRRPDVLPQDTRDAIEKALYPSP